MKPTAVASQVSGFTVAAAGLKPRSQEMVAQALPECKFLQSGLNSWEMVRFCKLVGPAILIVDDEALMQLQSEQIPAVEYLATAHVLVLCRDCNEHAYSNAISAGCAGMLELDAPPEHLRKAVQAIGEGVLWYPRAVLSALARKSILNRSLSQKKLTDREKEVLRLLGLDRKNQAIADQLYISRNTVRWHLRTLYSKIGVSNAQKHGSMHSSTPRNSITRAASGKQQPVSPIRFAVEPLRGGWGKTILFTLSVPLYADFRVECELFRRWNSGCAMAARGIKVLIADDCVAIREAYSEILTQLGYIVRTADEGFAALVEIRDDVPDVLLSDLHMPGMSGFELLALVRHQFPEIVVVA